MDEELIDSIEIKTEKPKSLLKFMFILSICIHSLLLLATIVEILYFILWSVLWFTHTRVFGTWVSGNTNLVLIFALILIFTIATVIESKLVGCCFKKCFKSFDKKWFFVLLASILLQIIAFSLIAPWPQSWGPAIMPNNNGVNVIWFTVFPQETVLRKGEKMYCSNEFANNTHECSTTQTSKSQVHGVFLPFLEAEFTINNQKYNYNLNNISKIAVISDIHDEGYYAERLVENFDIDLVLITGDVTVFSLLYEYQMTMGFFKQKPLIICPGNHDEYNDDYKLIMEEDTNSLITIGNISVYVLNTLENAKTSIEEFEAAVSFIKNNPINSKYKFIINHSPIYSEGSPEKGNDEFCPLLEPLFDSERFTAVFTGHSHSFGAYNRKGLMLFDSGMEGAEMFPLEYNWMEAHGVEDWDKRYGSKWFLDAYSGKNIANIIELGNEYITYSIYDMGTLNIIKEYNEDIV